MSWFLIILLVLIMLVFGASCVALIAWIVAGTPNVSASNTLVLNNDPFLPQSPLQEAVDTLNGKNVTTKVMLAANTGGFVIATGGPKEEITKENKLVQTLYVDGKPAVVKTTKFSQISHLESHGPVDVRQDPAQSEILQWFAHQATTSKNENDNVFINGDDEPSILSTKRLKELLIAERENTTVEMENSKMGVTMDAAERRRSELSAVAERIHSKRFEQQVNVLAKHDPNQFGIEVLTDPAPCSKSSTLQLPLSISVPTKFTTSLATLDALHTSRARWQIHEINPENDNKNTKILWQSEPISLYDVVKNQSLMLVDTGLKCREVARLLLRVKLVDCANQHVHAAAFFNTAQLVNKSHTPHTYPNHHDPHLAWKTFRQFQVASKSL